MPQDVICLSINNTYTSDNPKKLYEAANFAWRIAQYRVENNSIRYAFAIYHGQIKEVYEINRWLPADQLIPETRYPNSTDYTDEKLEEWKKKFAFEGKVASDIRNSFIGKEVQHPGQQGLVYKNFNEIRRILGTGNGTLLNDIKIIFPGSVSTEKENLIKCRIGQGEFRNKLIEYWNGCSVTGLEQTDILIASHIKPWSESSDEERLDKFNGLLLIPNLDKLFDKGYISFDNDGKILISPQLKDLTSLGVTQNMKIKMKLEHEKYLKYHKNNVFKTQIKHTKE